MTDGHRQAYLAAYEELARKGERVLLLAWREVEPRDVWHEEDLPSSGYVFIGLIGMLDPPRAEVPEAVKAIRSAGVRVVMVTGDYQTTAEAIGRMVGIVTGDRPAIINGEQLRTMGDDMLEWELEQEEVIFARTSPEQKLRIVQALQRRGDVVAVTGDGVNDAPALKQADIGVAMGLSGTDVAREAADMVLLDDNFATLLPAIREGRTIFDNLKKSIAYTVTHAVPEVAPYLAFLLLGIPLPLTVMLILSIDLGTDMIPAIALGMERAERDIMQIPPRSRRERLVNRRLLFTSFLRPARGNRGGCGLLCLLHRSLYRRLAVGGCAGAGRPPLPERDLRLLCRHRGLPGRQCLHVKDPSPVAPPPGDMCQSLAAGGDRRRTGAGRLHHRPGTAPHPVR